MRMMMVLLMKRRCCKVIIFIFKDRSWWIKKEGFKIKRLRNLVKKIKKTKTSIRRINKIKTSWWSKRAITNWRGKKEEIRRRS